MGLRGETKLREVRGSKTFSTFIFESSRAAASVVVLIKTKTLHLHTFRLSSVGLIS